MKLIISKLPDPNYEIDKPNSHTGNNIKIIYNSKLRSYNSPDKFNLSQEEKQAKVKSKLCQ